MIGGLLHHAIARTRKDTDEASSSGILCGSGLIAGEALMGIALAIPLALGVKLALNVEAIPPGLLDLMSLLLFTGLVGYFAWYARRPSTP
jgi:hypothetical protein